VYVALVVEVVCWLPPFNLTVYVTGHDAGDEEAVQETTAPEAVTLLAATEVGTVGTLQRVTSEPEAGLDEPPALVAVTWMVYDVPGARPVKDAVVPLTVCAKPPFSVTLYVTGQSGSDVDADHVTVAVVWVTLLDCTLVGWVGGSHAGWGGGTGVPTVLVNDPTPPKSKPGAPVPVFSNHVQPDLSCV